MTRNVYHEDILDLVKLADTILKQEPRIAEAFGKTAADPEAGVSEKVRRVLLAAVGALKAGGQPAAAPAESKELTDFRNYCSNLVACQSAIKEHMPKQIPSELVPYFRTVLNATFNAMQHAQAELGTLQDSVFRGAPSEPVAQEPDLERAKLEGELVAAWRMVDRLLHQR